MNAYSITGGEKNRLMIVACSDRKNEREELQSAFELYDGVAWRTLKAIGCDPHILGVSMMILSAEFGLIGCRQRLPNYDRKMDRKRARELAPETRSILRNYFEACRESGLRWDEIFIYCGETYMIALGTEQEIEGISGAKVIRATGRGCGDMMSAMKKYLLAVQAELDAEAEELIADRDSWFADSQRISEREEQLESLGIFCDDERLADLIVRADETEWTQAIEVLASMSEASATASNLFD